MRSAMPSPAAIAALRARHKKMEVERDKALKAKRVKAAKTASAVDAQPASLAAESGGVGVVGGSGAGSAAETLVVEYVDEYDPMRPNSFEVCNARRIELRERAEAERLRVELERQREEMARRRASPSGDAAETSRERNLNVSGEEAFRRRAGITAAAVAADDVEAFGLGLPAPAQPMASGAEGADERGAADEPAPATGGKSAAERIMEKMGWKEGRGLGRDEEGMTVPLVAKKIDARSGIIVAAEDKTAKTKSRAQPTKRRHVETPTRSRVIVMRNMVGPGEVDAELEDEVGSECSKYGEVLGVLIFEVTRPPDFPKEEAVRIFVKFASEDVACAALQVFNGRYFGGRAVRCSFYSEEKFDKEELAPVGGGDGPLARSL